MNRPAEFFCLMAPLAVLFLYLAGSGGGNSSTTVRVANHELLRGHQFEWIAEPLQTDPVRIEIRVQTYDVAIWSWENLSHEWLEGSGQPCGHQQRRSITGSSLVEHALFSGSGGRLQSGAWGNVNVGPYHAHGFYSPCSGGGAPALAPYDGIIDGGGASGWSYQCPSAECVVETAGSLTEDVTYTLHWHALDARTRAAWRRGYPLRYQPRLSFLAADVAWATSHGWWQASDWRSTVEVTITAH